MDTNYDFKSLRADVSKSVDEHNSYGGWDGTLYNASTILSITLAALASLLPIDSKYLKILSGMAAIIIAIDRSLNWGARWLYHRHMRHGYLNILAKITFFENLPSVFTDEERKIYFREIFTDLYTLRQKETEMPGVNIKDKTP